MENGDYLLLGTDRNVNIQEIARHSRHDADAMDQYSHDMSQVCQALKPLFDDAPPDLFSNDPDQLLQLADLAKRLRDLPKRVLHNCVRLLTGSSADFLDDYFESDIIKGLFSSSSIIGTKVGPRSQGSGLVLLYHNIGEHDGHFGSWGFHKGGNGGFTQVLARAAQGFGAEIMLDAAVDHVITSNGRATGVATGRRHRAAGQGRRQRARPATHVHAIGRPGRAAERSGRAHRPVQVPGHVGQGQLRPRWPAQVPGTGRPRRPVPRLHQHRPVDGLPRAGLRRRKVRLVQQAAVHRCLRAVDHRPRHGAARQARDVVLRAVRAVPPEGQRLGHRARPVRRHRAGHARVVLPRLRRSGAAARDRHAARHRASRRPVARATSSPASSSPRRCTSSAPLRAGTSTARRSTATTSAGRAPTRAAASPGGPGMLASRQIIGDLTRKG